MKSQKPVIKNSKILHVLISNNILFSNKFSSKNGATYEQLAEMSHALHKLLTSYDEDINGIYDNQNNFIGWEDRKTKRRTFLKLKL